MDSDAAGADDDADAGAADDDDESSMRFWQSASRMKQKSRNAGDGSAADAEAEADAAAAAAAAAASRCCASKQNNVGQHNGIGHSTGVATRASTQATHMQQTVALTSSRIKNKADHMSAPARKTGTTFIDGTSATDTTSMGRTATLWNVPENQSEEARTTG